MQFVIRTCPPLCPSSLNLYSRSQQRSLYLVGFRAVYDLNGMIFQGGGGYIAEGVDSDDKQTKPPRKPKICLFCRGAF